MSCSITVLKMRGCHNWQLPSFAFLCDSDFLKQLCASLWYLKTQTNENDYGLFPSSAEHNLILMSIL